MKHIIKIFWLSGFLILSSCIFGGDNSSSGLITLASESETEDSNRKNERSLSARRGRCEDNRECVNICEDIYEEDYPDDEDEDGEERVNTCIESGYNIVADHFERIYEILDSPSSSGLRNIEVKAFDEFLEISVKPWIELMKKASKSEAKAVLAWIAKDTKVSSAIEDAYKDSYENVDKYEGVAELFAELEGGSGNNCSKFCSRVSGVNILGKFSFWALLEPRQVTNQITTKNPQALDIVCELFKEECTTPTQRDPDNGEATCGTTGGGDNEISDICEIYSSN